MTSKNIYRSLGGLDPELIMKAAPAEKVQKRKKNTWIKWASMAACLCLIITAVLVMGEFDNVYFIGGITINMSGILWAFFIAPVLSVVCTLLLWLIDSGSIILPLWLFRDLCIPVLHFCILRHYIKNNKIRKKHTVIWSVILLIATVVVDSILMDFIVLKGRLAVPHVVFRLIWTVLCGMFILGHVIILRFYQNNIPCKIAVSLGAAFALSINAFMTYLLSPILATDFAIDGVELLLMPLALIILSLYSYLLGKIMTRRFIWFKLLVWLFGILASEFVALWLLGVPRTLPTEEPITMIVWIVTSAIAFVFCLFGVLKRDSKIRTGK